MSAESKPSKWAISAAAELFADRHGGVPLKVVGSAARVIDREAVAPAVRELVDAIDNLRSAYSADPPVPVGLHWAALIDAANRYRHLLDQPEEKP